MAYGLTEWMDPVYKGNDPMKRCIPGPNMIPETVRGIRRVGYSSNTKNADEAAVSDDDEDSDEV